VSAAATLAAIAAALGALGLGGLAPRLRRRRRPRARLAALLAALGRRIGVPAAPRELEARLLAAGRPLGLGESDAMALKGGAAALGLALAAPTGALLPGRLSLLVALVLPVGAFLAPDAWLRRRVRARARTMAAELPEVLDLLRVALGAGLALDRAFAEVARRDPGVLAREWRAVAAQLALGAPREAALAELVARCPCAGVAALARALERSFRHGAPLGETLAALAREARAEQARRLAERAARAAPQIQLIVALLLVPSVLLLVAAALLASLLA
jgi:tight adherence protein C